VVAAVLLVVIFAFVGLAVDTGQIMYHQTNMQNAVDAAALAASQEITAAVQAAGQSGGEADVDANSIAAASARRVAAEVAGLNGVYVDPDRDVRFGKRIYDEATGTWPIQWDAQPYNVVGVTARKDNPVEAAPDAKLRLSFGWALGRPTVDLETTAAAFVEARDIVVALDYSGSMSFDSQFRDASLDKLGQPAIEANLRQIWEDLGSPTYGKLAFTPDYATIVKAAANVTWTGKTAVISFKQNVDRVKLTFTTNNSQVLAGGSVGETKTFKGSGPNLNKFIRSLQVEIGNGSTPYDFYDSTTIKQALGLNAVSYPYPSGSWDNYITYCRNITSGTSFYESQLDVTGYRCKFGMMTLCEFWLKHYRSHAQTPDLWKTRHYPFHAMKEGTALFCDFLESLEFGDCLGLVTYATTTRAETTLSESGMPFVDISSQPITDDYDAINTIQVHKQAGHYDGSTNLGGGLNEAMELLNEHRRYGARPTILIMTDGNANERDPNWQVPSDWNWNALTDFDGDGEANYSTSDKSKLYAMAKAKEAADQGFTIHTLSVGSDADRAMMQAIAFIGNGTYIDVPGGRTIADMREELQAAFRKIAANVPPPKLVYQD